MSGVSHSQFNGTFFDFYPHYFDGFYAFGGKFAWMGLHLWYLLFLFIFVLLTLPLFIILQKTAGQRIVAGMAGFLTKPGAIFLMFLPVTVLDFALLPNTPMGIRDMGGWNLFTYMLLYIYGFILAGDTRLEDTVQSQRQPALIMGAITLLLLYEWSAYSGRPQTGYNSGYLLFTAGRCFSSWCLLIALLGYSRKYLVFSNSLLPYVNRLVLPFYILHQTVIVTIGFYVVQWNAGIAAKYMAISVSSLAVIMVLYEALIRRFRLLGFLFGLKMTLAGCGQFATGGIRVRK